VLDATGQVTTSALELITSTNFNNGNSAYDAIDRLGALIRINHGLLDALGVSHPRLERVRELVDYSGIGWTKLTGAGGGGCAITLFRLDVNEATVEELERKFMAEGFQHYEATLGADGVGVLWPAVFRNGPDGGNGEEIDQEKFENAIGARGIEQLVGVGVREDGEGWKFWTRG
jgi:mevalonate kinase